MRALVQRVSSAAVSVEGARVSEIGPGLPDLDGVAAAVAHRRHRDMAWLHGRGVVQRQRDRGRLRADL